MITKCNVVSVGLTTWRTGDRGTYTSISTGESITGEIICILVNGSAIVLKVEQDGTLINRLVKVR